MHAGESGFRGIDVVAVLSADGRSIDINRGQSQKPQSDGYNRQIRCIRNTIESDVLSRHYLALWNNPYRRYNIKRYIENIARNFKIINSFRPFARSLREGLSAVPGQENKEEKDHGEEEHSLSRLQRGARVRRSRGERRGCHPYSESNRLRQVKEHCFLFSFSLLSKVKRRKKNRLSRGTRM